jgi:Bacterial SH3 domain
MIRHVSLGVSVLLISASTIAQSVQRASNLRDSPSTNGIILDTLKPDAKLSVRSRSPIHGYLLVRTSDGKSGWVLARNVSTQTPNLEILAAHSSPLARTNSDLFEPGCDSPAFPSADSTPIDSECPVEGTGTKDDEAQNSEKNNFCAAGQPNIITIEQMTALQQKVRDEGTVNFGSSFNAHPYSEQPGPATDRSTLTTLGEGSPVTMVGYILDAASEGPETVNCKLGTKSSADAALHDIHITIVKSLQVTDKCSGIVAEMIPHHRPDAWTPQLLKQVKAAHKQIRVTGNLLFDSSHTECVNGSALSGDPSRVSLWEIHPIYKFEVCSASNCGSGEGFVDLEQWQP